MTKLFKHKDPVNVRSVRYPILLTEEEAMTIRQAASIRQLSVAEFIRRAALGRKADVDYETEIVLVLSGITRVIRGYHAALVERGVAPPEAEMSAVIVDARAAIHRITK